MSPTAPLNAPATTTLAQARAHARRQRATWLQLLVAGEVDIVDLVSFAATDEGVSLRSLKLRDILDAAPGWGRLRTRAAITRVLATQECHERWDQVRLSWLLDGRASASRMSEWCAQITGVTSLWAGFPYLPAPKDG